MTANAAQILQVDSTRTTTDWQMQIKCDTVALSSLVVDVAATVRTLAAIAATGVVERNQHRSRLKQDCIGQSLFSLQAKIYSKRRPKTG